VKLLQNITLPNQTLMQFANLQSKEIWRKKIEVGSQFYPKAEYETVKHGVRKCMIAHNVDPSAIHTISKNLLKDGLIMVPLSKEGNNGEGFGHVSQGYNGQGNFRYRAVIGTNIHDVNEFVHAHNEHNDLKIGELLGYPECCSKFFDENWKSGYFDPIWQQAENTSKPMLKNRKEFRSSNNEVEKSLIRLRDSHDAYKIHSVFRYIGIRTISHLPCCFNCQESIEVSNQWLSLGWQLNLPGIREILDILALPFEWDCFKGIALVNTPVFKITTTSMPCYPKYIVQGESDFYPDEAPDGIQFPWKFKGIVCK
jgi:hypothetical protein